MGRAHGNTGQNAAYARSGTIWQSEDVPILQAMPPPWTLVASLEEHPRALKMRPHLATAARWSPDGHQVITGSDDGIARIWQLTGSDVHGRGRLRWDIVTSQQVDVSAIWSVAWSP